MAERTLETRVDVLTKDVETIKRKLRSMEDVDATETALVLAARSDSLRALELIPKIDDNVRALRVELKSEIGHVRNDLGEFRTEFDEFRKESDEFRKESDEFRKESDEFRTEFDEFRKESGEFRTEFDEFRAEVYQRFAEVNQQFKVHGELLKRIADHLGV
jgi:uncharacterized coiled-coil DUF342 family protein